MSNRTSMIQEQYDLAARERREMERPLAPAPPPIVAQKPKKPKTTAVKVPNINAEFYAKVKAKAKEEGITIKSLVEGAFANYLSPPPEPEVVEVVEPAPAPVTPDDPVLEMLAEKWVDAQAELMAGDKAMDPQRSKRARGEMAMIKRLQQAAAASRAHAPA